jgi:hypothetical protein
MYGLKQLRAKLDPFHASLQREENSGYVPNTGIVMVRVM